MFSICMLTYNNHDTFQRSLQSMTQLLLDDRVTELIILDNGSHEMALRNLLQRTEKMYSKVKVHYSSENLGIAKGRKFLFDICKGDYILSFDSDIVVLDANNLLTILLEAFKNPDIWLIGGGGGNHPYFPSLFREYIHNLKEAKNPAQLTFVEEVAGWFHGFRASMLVKNGGQVYMDERFTPFWGEDSDFCMQIRMLGGKCAILGAGLVGHRWSSCDKKDTQKTIDDMWVKFTDKWYPKFGDTFQFDFDEDFYRKYYGDKIKHKLALVDYLLQGMPNRYLANGRFLSKLFNFKYEGDDILFQDNKYTVPQFIDKFMNKDCIIEHNFRTVDNRLKDSKFLVVMHSDDDKKSMEILRRLKEKNDDDFALAFTYVKNKKHPKCLDFINNHLKNFMINQFVEYHDHTIANILTFEKVDKNYDHVVFLHNHQQADFLNANLEYFLINENFGNKVKSDIRTADAINRVYTHRKDNEYYSEAVFMAKAEKLKRIIATRSVQTLLGDALFIPTRYHLHLSPRQTPRHGLERLLGYMLLRPDNDRTLIVVDANIEDVKDKDRCANNNKWFKKSGECDIMVMNRGSLRHLKSSELNCDYYYLTQNNGNKIDNWKNAFGLCNSSDYNNFILTNLEFTIEEPVTEFFELAKYSNISMLEQKGSLNEDLIALQLNELAGFFQIYDELNKMKKEKPELDMDKTFNFNIRRNLQMHALWQVDKEEDDEEISLSYTRKDDKFEPDVDFPLLMEN